MKKIRKYTNKELAEAHIFPSQLSPDEKKKTEKEFSEFRKQRLLENVEYGVDSRYKSNKERESDGIALMEARLKRMKNKSTIKSDMKKFEIGAPFIGYLVVEVEANSAEEAKENFLTSFTELNGFGDPSVTIENVLLPSVKPIVLKELNMAFPKELTDEDKIHWGGMEIDEIDKDYDK
jgi:hypothetical protein